MPLMDGYEATKTIRRREFDKKNIKIIAMTANAMKSDYDNCIEAGMDDYISKPFKANDLIKIIIKWLKKSNSKPDEACGIQQDTMLVNNQAEDIEIDVSKILDGLAKDQKIDRNVIYEIYNEFIEVLPATLKKINNAVCMDDFPTVTMEAHTLKGASAGLRLKSLSQIAAELEKQSKAENIAICKDCIIKIIECQQTYLRNKLNVINEIK